MKEEPMKEKPVTAFEFERNCETGNRDIDGHVRTLLTIANEVLFSEALRASARQFQSAVAFLVGYLEYHFVSEESAMVAEHYPSRHIHSAFHAHVLHEAEALKRRANKGDASEEIRRSIYFMIEDWLIYHVQVDDLRFAAFLRETPSTRAIVRLPGILDLKAAGSLSPDFDEEMVERAATLGHMERLAWSSPVLKEDRPSQDEDSTGTSG